MSRAGGNGGDAALPPSATHALVAWCGVCSLLLAVTLLNFLPIWNHIAYQALFVMAAAALGVFVPDLLWQKVHRRTLTSPSAGNMDRSLTKLAGLAGSVGFVALLYWVFPEYGAKGFYADYWQAIRVVLPAWAVLALPYIYWVDRRLAQPRDALWHMGGFVLCRWQNVSAPIVVQHLLGWLVKGYFLPLMFTYFCGNLNKLLHYDLELLRNGFRGWYDWAYFTLYFIDVALVSMTYLMSLKATDTHIRSTEPTGAGWLVALVCYEPFWSTIGSQYLSYANGTEWGTVFARSPAMYDLWGSMILVLVIIYVWATVVFGGRFSNLTHRGIITSGPYRYTKHPAYLAKNLSWWMISMPFIYNGSWLHSLRCCLALLMLNGIYYLRAKTEERHLSLDPVYCRYADWIDRNGLLSGLVGLPVIGPLLRWRPVFFRDAQPE